MSNYPTAVTPSTNGHEPPSWCKNQEKPKGYMVKDDWRLEEFSWGGIMIAHSVCQAYTTSSIVANEKQVCSNCGMCLPEEVDQFFNDLLNLRRL